MLAGVLASFVLLGVPFARAASADEWRSRSIYQVITDRFSRTNDTRPMCDTSKREFCGGSWKGIENKLDYIQGLGFDAVWVSPVVKNIEGNTTYGQAFHGYWTQDITQLDSHYGTPDDLKSLSAALHARGMYFMLDIVVNHMVSEGMDVPYSSFVPLNKKEYYHPPCFITDYTNTTMVEQCWLGDDKLPLVDINTEDPTVVDTMNKWIAQMVQDYDIDGLRIDTFKHIRSDFWPDFIKSAGVFTLAEVLNYDTASIAPYTQYVDAVFDYSTWTSLIAGFTTTAGDLSNLSRTVEEVQHQFKSGQFMTGSFLDNHDQPRFQSHTSDPALSKNAFTWMFVNDGIPVVYQGTEQGYQGGMDPSNREALWLSNFTIDRPLADAAKRLNAARKAAISSNPNFLTTPVKFLEQDTNFTLAVSKPPLLALLTNIGNNASGALQWAVPDAGFKPNEPLVNILTCETSTAGPLGGVGAQSFYGDPQVLMPAAALSKNGNLCTDKAMGEFVVAGGAASRPVSWGLLLGTMVLGMIATYL